MVTRDQESEMIATAYGCETIASARQDAAQAAIQQYIDAQQDYDAIEYGLRCIRVCSGESYCTGVHRRTLTEACRIGAQKLGRAAIYIDGSSATYWLREAKKVAKSDLDAAKAEKKQIGTARQLRFALAGEETI